ncbi:hypothetical protein PbB2_01780 [Candidatus Phycosocius bacilliformis]|uniref:Flp/Fap pilin component n=1 Tax=Candidatus Phycosocius bacilliformis TaxID=1445552 RepID=A0A2P2EAQ0_9PROT|nr:Flp family type IVb pilin [Candidatus Phycosocius bacilliformis]GBF58109.1 hypothetical protein PbB2_01780 [Candidatus Phycosocius bacilliformis]
MNWKRLKNERGATAIEYGLIAAFMTVVMIVGLRHVGTSSDGMYANVTSNILAAIGR